MKINIMIADDHPLFRGVLRTIINSQDDMTVVAEAENGVDAVKQVMRHKPGVILMDIKMPGMDGIDATRQICAAFPGTKIIALSTYVEETYSQKMIDAGAWTFLPKNCQQQDLLDCIRTMWAATTPVKGP